jgi:hypothetical protein
LRRAEANVKRGIVGLGDFTPLAFKTVEHGGFRYRTIEGFDPTWWLGSFMVRSVAGSEKALVASAEYEIAPPAPLGQRKSALSWEDEQRRVLGNATVVVPMPNWDGATPLHVVPGTIQIWSTTDIDVAADLANPDKPGFNFVIAPPRDGWRVGQATPMAAAKKATSALPWVIGTVGAVAAVGTVLWLVTRKK